MQCCETDKPYGRSLSGMSRMLPPFGGIQPGGGDSGGITARIGQSITVSLLGCQHCDKIKTIVDDSRIDRPADHIFG